MERFGNAERMQLAGLLLSRSSRMSPWLVPRQAAYKSLGVARRLG